MGCDVSMAGGLCGRSWPVYLREVEEVEQKVAATRHRLPGGGTEMEGMYRRFRRNRIPGILRKARGVLELPAGITERTGTEVGDEVELRM